MSKKLIMIIVSVVLIVAMIVGLSFGISSCSKKKDVAKYSEVLYFSTSQSTSRPAVFRAYAVGKKLTKMTYRIDTDTEVVINNCDAGPVNKDWEYFQRKYKKYNYIDSNVITIDLSDYPSGQHIFSITVYNGDKAQSIYQTIFNLK